MVVANNGNNHKAITILTTTRYWQMRLNETSKMNLNRVAKYCVLVVD